MKFLPVLTPMGIRGFAVHEIAREDRVSFKRLESVRFALMFEVYTAVKVHIVVFSFMTPYSLARAHQHFKETCCLIP